MSWILFFQVLALVGLGGLIIAFWISMIVSMVVQVTIELRKERHNNG